MFELRPVANVSCVFEKFDENLFIEKLKDLNGMGFGQCWKTKVDL